MNTKHRILALLVTGTALAGYASSAHAALIAYDGFSIGAGAADYTDAGLNGQNPTNPGFTGAWYGFGDSVVSGAESLTYSGVQSNNTGGIGTDGSGQRLGRNIAAPFTSTTAGTFYLSFLTSVPASPGYRSFEMFTGGVNVNRTLQAGFNGDIHGSEWGVRLNDSTVALSGVTALTDQTVLFVFKFTLSATDLSDSVTFWVNPSDLSSEAGSGPGVGLTAVNFAAEQLAVASFSGGLGGNFDEFRIGTTFNDVTTVIPEPSSLLLLGAGGLLAFKRRRRA